MHSVKYRRTVSIETPYDEAAGSEGPSAWPFGDALFGAADHVAGTGNESVRGAASGGGSEEGQDERFRHDSASISIQHTEIFQLAKDLRTACAAVNNANLSPPPYQYFHLLNFVIMVSLALLGYALIFNGTYLTVRCVAGGCGGGGGGW